VVLGTALMRGEPVATSPSLAACFVSVTLHRQRPIVSIPWQRVPLTFCVGRHAQRADSNRPPENFHQSPSPSGPTGSTAFASLSVFWDIGANGLAFIVFSAGKRDEDTEVVAFEPFSRPNVLLHYSATCGENHLIEVMGLW